MTRCRGLRVVVCNPLLTCSFPELVTPALVRTLYTSDSMCPYRGGKRNFVRFDS